MTERIVIIGADAAGMSAASQAKRIAGDAVEIVAFERGAYSSYSACGIPYWVAGDVGGPERLVARSPEAHRRNGIDLRMRTEVEKIDLAGGWVLVHDLAAGRSFREGFDSLVIATGAVPVRPPLPCRNGPICTHRARLAPAECCPASAVKTASASLLRCLAFG